MKWNKKYLNNAVRISVIMVLLVSVIGFAERSPEGDVCRDIIISIDNHAENYFLAEDDIMNLITNHGLKPVAGAPFTTLNLKTMEQIVNEEPFVEEAEIYRDLKSNLHVNVALRRPMARIIRTDGPHAYIAEDRTLMPVSNEYSSRVLLISGDVDNALHGEGDQNEAVMELVEQIYKDEFWSGQIAQIHIKRNGEILMYPQVTKQIIEFGMPEDAEEKFKKLKIFYKKILPNKGWNAYSRVNVAFKDQIIAE